MKNIKKTVITIALLVCSAAVIAGGWTTYSASSNAGKIEWVEVVRAQGFLVSGDFGNPANCEVAGRIWVPIDHPQYDQLYSMVLTAFTSGKKIQAHAAECTAIGWHGGTYNTLTGAGAMYLRN